MTITESSYWRIQCSCHSQMKLIKLDHVKCWTAVQTMKLTPIKRQKWLMSNLCWKGLFGLIGVDRWCKRTGIFKMHCTWIQIWCCESVFRDIYWSFKKVSFLKWCLTSLCWYHYSKYRLVFKWGKGLRLWTLKLIALVYDIINSLAIVRAVLHMHIICICV